MCVESAGQSTGFLVSTSGEVRCWWCRDVICFLRASVFSSCHFFLIVAYKIVPHLGFVLFCV